MNPITAIICIAIAASLVAVIALAVHYLREKCTRCGSRNTRIVRELPGLWICHGCYRYFGPGSTYMREGRR